MKIEAFTKTYQDRIVLQFPGGEFTPGSIYAVLGPNGSGKSTFASVISGILRSDQGVPVVSDRSNTDSSDQGVPVVSASCSSDPSAQDSTVLACNGSSDHSDQSVPAVSDCSNSDLSDQHNSDLRCEDITAVSEQMPQDNSPRAGMKTGFLPQRPYAFHMSLKKNLLLNGEGTRSEKNERARYLMDALSLSSLSSKNAASLSGGESAKMALSRLLMKKYDLLILDEPCASMDLRSIRQTENLLREYVGETNCILFLITHSFRQAERIADEVLFLKEGRLLERGTPGQVLHDPRSVEVKEILEF